MIGVTYWKHHITTLDLGHAGLFWNATYKTFDQKTTKNYASWWPSNPAEDFIEFAKNLTYGGRAILHTLEDDISAEGRSPYLIDVDGLDETAIQKAWDFFKSQLRYGLWFDNCATTVASLLKSGGACLVNPTDQYFKSIVQWAPRNVTIFAGLINDNISDIKREITAGKTPTLGDTAGHGVMNHFEIVKRRLEGAGGGDAAP